MIVMRVLPRKFFFPSRSRCHRRPAHGHSPDLLKQQDAQQASPCRYPDVTGGSTLNGDAKVEVDHGRSTDDCDPEERKLDAGSGEHRISGDSEAEETSSSDEAVRDEDETSENGSAADERTPESVDDGICKRRVDDVKDKETTAIHGIDEEHGSPSLGVENEQKATRDREGAEEDGHVSRRDGIRSSFRRSSSDAGSQVPKKVRWAPNSPEVHVYERNQDDAPTNCVCIVM